MLEKFEEGFDVVHTRRTKRHGENRFKMWVTRNAYRVINVFSDIDLPENVGDFKLISRRALNYLLEMEEKEPYLRGLVTWIGFNQTTVLYERDKRLDGKTHYPLIGKGPFYAFISGITSFSSAPLYMSFFLGFGVSFFAFIYLLYIVISRLVYGIHQPGWPALMATTLFLSGIILFTNGIMGIYIGKIFVNVKKRPLFIIQESIGFNTVKNKNE